MHSSEYQRKHGFNYNYKLKVGETYWCGNFTADLVYARTQHEHIPMAFKVVGLLPKKGRGWGEQPIKIETVEGKRHAGCPRYDSHIHHCFKTKEECVEYYNLQVAEYKADCEKKIKDLQAYLANTLDHATLDVNEVGKNGGRKKGGLTI